MRDFDLDTDSILPSIEVPLRFRALVDSYFSIILLVAVILTVVTGFWVYDVHIAQEIQTDQETEVVWSETTNYDHSSLVTNDSLPFAVGDRMQNRPMYYTRINDDLDVDFTYEYTASEGDLTVSTESFVRYEASEGDDILWEYVDPKASETTRSMSPDANHSKRVTVNIENVFETIAQIEEQLGATGTTEITVVTAASIEGEAGGQSVSEEHDSRLQFTVNPETFRVLETDTVSEEHLTVEIIETVEERSLVERILSILSFALSVLFLLSLMTGRYAGYLTLSEDEITVIELRQQEQEFSEWITSGTFPAEREYEATIMVDDLEGLVDVAIDSNRRVIKDEQLGVATVLDDNYVYIYVWPNSPARDWLVNYADMTIGELRNIPSERRP